MLHLILHDAAERIERGARNLEDELVVNLQGHDGIEAVADDASVESDHRELHEIGRAALQRRIGRFTLGRGAQAVIFGPQIRHVPPPAQ